MSTPKHTPGPWKLCYDGQIDGANGATVLRFNWDSYKEFNDLPTTEKGNIRLIAAAPELLAALQDAIKAYDYDLDIPWGTIRQAVAQATKN